MPMKVSIRLLIAIIALTLLCVFIYAKGLHGDFEFDDAQNISNNSKLDIQKLDWQSIRQAALSGDAGVLKRPISMLSFALNAYACGFIPFCFKQTNLLIHIITGLSLLLLTYLLLTALRKNGASELPVAWINRVSLFVAAAWMLHPLAITSILYVVQRMNSLSALFMVWALVAYVWGRQRLCDGKPGVMWASVGTLVFGILSIFSKENGALLPLFMLSIELMIFRFQAPSRRASVWIRGLFLVVVAVPIVGFLIFLSAHPEWLTAGYGNREFSLTERLLTESRIVWFYLRLIFLPDVSLMGIFHDDIAISHGLFSPISTVFSIMGLCLLFAAMILSYRRAPILSFGLLWFFCGHAMESTVFPLEIAHEHRNYLPMYGILLAMFFYLLYPVKYVKCLGIRHAAAVALIVLYAILTYSRAAQWGNLVDHAAMEVANHPASERANYQLGRIYFMLYTNDPKEKYYERASFYFSKTDTLALTGNGGLFALIQLAAKAKKEISPAWVNKLANRLATLPYQPSNTAFLKNLLSCQLYQYCKLGESDMMELLNAPLHNPYASSMTKADAYTMLGEYSFNGLKKYSDTGEYFVKASKLVPEHNQYRVNLLHYYSVTGQFEKARKELSSARDADRLGEYKLELDAEKIFLENRESGKK